MTTEAIKIGDFGEMKAGMVGYKKTLHGWVKDKDSFGNLFFEDTEGKAYIFSPDQIDRFVEKTFTPLPEEVRGHKITWSGGQVLFTDTRKECDLKK